ncbi:hypothetical protein [Mycolicibacterium wolinskyi]|uniref:hypothetical protein n=1 Tax=Mycolicibacterium wolinskyi TaxID=59750 RepID=UPI000A51B2B8|nr:hypothetical protein [Mycolicibacterium wolinskyi]
MTTLTAAIVAAICCACSTKAPDLPSDIGPAAIADLIAGPEGTRFLEDITAFEWSDEGRQAGDLVAWVARDARSTDPKSAERAGRTAYVIAQFLADGDTAVKSAGERNPALLASYADALVPYQGTMIGDPSGTSGFTPLDDLSGNLPRTSALFSVFQRTAAGNNIFIDEAKRRAISYEQEFAKFAAANPTDIAADEQPQPLLWAARLLGLLSRGNQLAHSDQDDIAPGVTTQLRYEITSRMVRGSNPRISPQFFAPDGSLIPPDDLHGGPLNLYSAQLTGYLSTYPQIEDAIRMFGQEFAAIATP